MDGNEHTLRFGTAAEADDDDDAAEKEDGADCTAAM
jgi:hypothetical protein